MKRINIFLFTLMIACSSCRKDPTITDPSAKLEFSTDTVLFDTVFTTIGSTTQWLLVHNPHNRKIIISEIILAGGQNSRFRVNVDGTPGTSFKNVEIQPKDSIFVFVEVTVDPNNSGAPLVITDSLMFLTNGNPQNVKLVAWGQDAFFYNYAIACDYILAKTKPHVIYNLLLVDSGCTLFIEAGTTVYMHNNAMLIVLKGGTLKVNGTINEPVVFRGDRLENFYDDVPGQWQRIWLSAGSKDNEINYAIIKNGTVGIQADTLGNSTNPTLKIDNTIIQNMTGAGIFAQGSYIRATNCAITDCGVYLAALTIGGDYEFRHCTFANFWSQETRQTGAIVLNNYYEDINGNKQYRDLQNAYFGNCIISGSLEDEVELDENTAAMFNYKFDYCLLKTKKEVTDQTHYTSIVKNEDPKFKDAGNYDLQLSAGSFAIDKGDISISAAVPVDIKGVTRDANPDLGAYEYQQ
ncbi:MAG: hypothetical protein HYY40_12505 [Bacteroidetes bacterium]|nr:hypothetical protein [Bacteroidota bacterium]